jgi:uncharacterized protein
MKFLFPKQPAFFDYFKELNNCIKEISILFSEFSNNFSNFEDYWTRAKKIEHRADQITRKIIKELNASFITPFDREDIYSLAQRLDDIVDLTENAIQNICLYEIKEKREAIKDFSVLILEASSNLDKLIHECFKKKINTDNVNEWIIKIHDLEDQGDLAFQRAIKDIFEKENNCINVIKWKDIIQDLESVMDQYKKVSSSIVGVIVKSF